MSIPLFLSFIFYNRIRGGRFPDWTTFSAIKEFFEAVMEGLFPVFRLPHTQSWSKILEQSLRALLGCSERS
jgi:hypothetical protein